MTTAIGPFGLKRKVFAIAGSALLVALLAGCGGGDKEDDGNDTGSTTETNATATTTTGSSSSGSASTPSSGTSSGSNAPSANSAAFSNLNSYKYSMKLSGNGGPLADISGELGALGAATSNVAFEVSGAYIKPDKAQTSIKIAGFETSTVIIGTQQWNTFAGQTQGPLPATASDVEDANFLAGFWSGESLADHVKDFKCGGKENVNGVSATKCNADKATLQKIAQSSPEFLEGINANTLSNGNADLWLADAGYPVRMRMDLSGKDTANKDFSIKIEMDVTDINGNFQITAPKS